MAKANRKKAATPVASAVLLPSDPHDINPRQMDSIQGASRKDVGWKSDSEPVLEATAAQAAENAALVGDAWAKRVRKEGKPYYACPLCSGAEVAFHHAKEATAKKACQAHINHDHPARVKELKLLKAPKARYTPQRKIQSPKRTMADAVHPKYRAQVEASLKMREALKPITDMANAISAGNSNALIKLVTMTESLAIQKLPTLNDKDLIQVAQIARNRGKRLLAKAASRLCEQKRLSINALPERSVRQQQIQEAIMNASFAAAAGRR